LECEECPCSEVVSEIKCPRLCSLADPHREKDNAVRHTGLAADHRRPTEPTNPFITSALSFYLVSWVSQFCFTHPAYIPQEVDIRKTVVQ